MDLDRVKRVFTLFLTAFGIFSVIFLTVTVFMISRIAQKKDKQEIKKGYAEEMVSVTPTPSIPG